VWQLPGICSQDFRLLVRFQAPHRESKLTLPSDNAGILGITVSSHKTLIGSGSAGVIKGKGIRIVSGANNIIIQ
jgi:pectate lyase